MFTAAAVSPGVSAAELITSLVVLGSIYAVLLVVEVRLLVKYARGGVASAMPELAGVAHSEKKEKKDDDGGTPGAQGRPGDSDDVLAFAY
jgi:cytochrome d ubiquinol oxidase subunit I